jgi:hypothetical protein
MREVWSTGTLYTLGHSDYLRTAMSPQLGLETLNSRLVPLLRKGSQAWWLKPVIPVTWVVEIRRTVVQSKPGYNMRAY